MENRQNGLLRMNGLLFRSYILIIRKHAKASRDFFFKSKDKLLCSSSLVKNNTPSCTPALSEGTICTQVDNNSVSADNSKGDPNSNTRDQSYVDSIPIPRTVDVSTLTVDRCKGVSKSVNFPTLERIENCIFIVNNEGIALPEGLQKQAPHWKTSLFQDKENEGKVDSLLTNKDNLPKPDVNKGEKTEISDQPSFHCKIC